MRELIGIKRHSRLQFDCRLRVAKTLHVFSARPAGQWPVLPGDDIRVGLGLPSAAIRHIELRSCPLCYPLMETQAAIASNSIHCGARNTLRW